MIEFTVTLANRPGQLASLAEAISDAGIHIEALAAFTFDGQGEARLMVDDETAARWVLRDAGLKFGERTVIATILPPEPKSAGDHDTPACGVRRQHRCDVPPPLVGRRPPLRGRRRRHRGRKRAARELSLRTRLITCDDLNPQDA